MINIKSYFNYNKRQRNGILFLLLIIVLLQLVFFFVDFSNKNSFEVSNTQLIAFEKEFDSLQKLNFLSKKFEIKPFNPNYITDYKGYQLGMSTKEIDKLLLFRKTGKYVNSKKEFQKVTGVSDSLLLKISPLFKFPNWVSKQKKKSKPKKLINLPLEKRELNKATAQDFFKIGISEYVSARIVKYRNSIKGFYFEDQLNEVYGLNDDNCKEILNHFEIKQKPIIQKLNINEATFKEVLALPYIDYELTKKIFTYKNKVAEIQSIEELKKIDTFPLEKFNRIALYLFAK
ncbi:helix-hairpin-helix domain-containing protein [Lutibacter sp. TH_r2]|uniref:helix-hairpin-helix domain-containing protein n=1 Tax=Lutibacter sp. TH_r2 TaxID=3082083 RepID=UPI0029544160|nr:helix-hairpin-helix domain-containing protein [Lutibacter sp. TH_r2]MDV7187222.1 helix-hairpin-helix domain-containing protein [Lutibacter sp. TH_r2]